MLCMSPGTEKETRSTGDVLFLIREPVGHGQCLFEHLTEATKELELVGTGNFNYPGIC